MAPFLSRDLRHSAPQSNNQKDACLTVHKAVVDSNVLCWVHPDRWVFLAGVRRVTWSGPVVQEITTVKPRCGGNLRESRSLFRIDPVMIIAPPLLAFADYLMIQIRNLTACVLFRFRLSFSFFPAHALPSFKSHRNSFLPQRPHYYFFPLP